MSQHDQQNTAQAWVFRQVKSVIADRSPSGRKEVTQHPAGAVSMQVVWVVNQLWSFLRQLLLLRIHLIGWDGYTQGFLLFGSILSISPESSCGQSQTSFTYLLVYPFGHTRSPTSNVDKQLVWELTLTTVTPFCLTLTYLIPCLL